MELKSLGTITSPYKEGGIDPPRQGFLNEIESTIVVDEAYRPAMLGLKEGMKVLVLYWAGKADRKALVKTSHKGKKEDRGVFSLRSPSRPNPINASSCLIVGIDIETGRIRLKGLEALDGSRLVDIKIAIENKD